MACGLCLALIELPSGKIRIMTMAGAGIAVPLDRVMRQQTITRIRGRGRSMRCSKGRTEIPFS